MLEMLQTFLISLLLVSCAHSFKTYKAASFNKNVKAFSKDLDSNSTYSIGDSLAHTFDGIGAVSGGGATSRLLVNYKDPYRSEILDYLFKPNFGASLQILKVEIGGDGQSTEGTEPSHMHNENEEDYTRGYEWFLMKEAKKRNPNITLVGLPWAWPGWIGDGTSLPYANRTRTADYVVKWVKGAKKHHNLTINFVGIWNERPYDKEYIKVLRSSLDKAGLKSVGIVAADGAQFITISESILNDKDLNEAVAVIGAHYPGTFSGRVAHKTNKPLWSSEDYSTYNDVIGAGCLARILNQNYVTGNITATIMWNLIASYYDDLPFNRCSLMTANQPWSGHYDLTDPLWVTAHTTQFTKPGWKYLSSSSMLSKGGSFVALTDGKEELTIVIESMSHDNSVCIRPPLPGYQVERQTVVFQLDDHFKNVKKLNLWTTQLGKGATPETTFKNEGQMAVNRYGQVSLDVAVDMLITLTTVSHGNKGKYPTPPPSGNFPLPYHDNFDSESGFSEANNFADQSGSFEYFTNTSSSDGHSKTLRQVVTQRPVTWCDDPEGAITVVGDYSWSTSFNASVALKAESSGGVFIALRVDKGGCDAREAHGLFFWLLNSSWMITSDLNRSKYMKRCMFEWTSCWNAGYYLDDWNNVTLSISPKNHFYAHLNGKLVADFDVATKTDVPANGFVALGTANYGYGQFDDFSVTLF